MRSVTCAQGRGYYLLESVVKAIAHGDTEKTVKLAMNKRNFTMTPMRLLSKQMHFHQTTLCKTSAAPCRESLRIVR